MDGLSSSSSSSTSSHPPTNDGNGSSGPPLRQPSIYPPSPGAARRRPTAKMGRIDTSGMSFGAVYGLSCVSACVAETVTFPLDLVRTRVQAERMTTCVWAYVIYVCTCLDGRQSPYSDLTPQAAAGRVLLPIPCSGGTNFSGERGERARGLHEPLPGAHAGGYQLVVARFAHDRSSSAPYFHGTTIDRLASATSFTPARASVSTSSCAKTSSSASRTAPSLSGRLWWAVWPRGPWRSSPARPPT